MTWAVYRTDLTNLGGPMGSEYTVKMPTKYFKHFKNAHAFAMKEICDKKGKPIYKHFPEKFQPGKYYDCNWIGIEIKKFVPKIEDDS